MISIVMQLQPAYKSHEDNGFIPSMGARRRQDERAAVSPEVLRAEDAALRSAIARDSHLNVLVQCVGIATGSAYDVLADLCPRPPQICILPSQLTLPTDGSPLLIGDVCLLTLRQQIALFDWLDESRGVAQVISLTSQPLWPLVRNGRFIEGLFYRLNVLSVQAAALSC